LALRKKGLKILISIRTKFFKV